MTRAELLRALRDQRNRERNKAWRFPMCKRIALKEAPADEQAVRVRRVLKLVRRGG